MSSYSSATTSTIFIGKGPPCPPVDGHLWPVGCCADYLYVFGFEQTAGTDDDEAHYTEDYYIYAYNRLTRKWRAFLIRDTTEAQQHLRELSRDAIFNAAFMRASTSATKRNLNDAVEGSFVTYDRRHGRLCKFFIVQIHEETANFCELDVDDLDGTLAEYSLTLEGPIYVRDAETVLFVDDTDVKGPSMSTPFTAFHVFQLQRQNGNASDKWFWSCISQKAMAHLAKCGDSQLCASVNSTVGGVPIFRNIFCTSSQLVFMPMEEGIPLDRAVAFDFRAQLYHSVPIGGDPRHGHPLNHFSCSPTLAVHSDTLFWPADVYYAQSSSSSDGNVVFECVWRNEFWLCDLGAMVWRRVSLASFERAIWGYSSAIDENGTALYLVVGPECTEREELAILRVQLQPAKLSAIAAECVLRHCPCENIFPPHFVPTYSNTLQFARYLRKFMIENNKQ